MILYASYRQCKGFTPSTFLFSRYKLQYSELKLRVEILNSVPLNSPNENSRYFPRLLRKECLRDTVYLHYLNTLLRIVSNYVSFTRYS